LVLVLCDEASRQVPEFLDSDRPVYALKHQGGDGERIPLNTVEAIAERYLADLRSAVPSGPVILCGYSFGGVVAYEMAQRLAAIGERPPLVIVIDSYAPSLHMDAMDQGRNYLNVLKDLMFARVVERRLNHGVPLKGKLNHFHIIHTYSDATAMYRPKPYAGQLAVIRAADGWGPADLGWYGLAQGRFSLREMHCDHVAIVKSNTRELAALISQLLKEAEC
jgi:pimeloyl-ACP methyl ester carboxylesterase